MTACLTKEYAHLSILTHDFISGFSAVYCFDGILRERPFEMVGFAVGIFIIMVYVIVDYSLEGNQGDVYRLVSGGCTYVVWAVL